MKSLLNQEKPVYILTFLSSLVISAYIYWQNGIINYDGILYIDVAKSFLEGGVSAAYTTFNWPLYGILIGITHKLTSLSYETSAHLLNALLVAITCTSFVAVYKEIDQKGTRAWFAALLILSLPVLNDYRELIIRNFGYWAFSLLALLYFLKFSRRPTLGTSALWQSAAIVATAFRIEGVALFIAPALFYLLKPARLADKIRAIFASSYLFAVIAVVASLLIVVSGIWSRDRSESTLKLWLSYMSPASMIEGIHAESMKLHEQLEYLSSTDEAALVLSIGLLSLAITKVATNAVLPYLFVSAYGAKKHWLRFTETNRIVTLFFILASLSILAILASRYFLSSRYTVTAVLFLSLITFQYVDIAFQKLAAMQNRRWYLIGSAAILVIFLDGVISLQSPKVIIRSGAQWALENLDQSRPWLCNEVRLEFYTNGNCKTLSPESLSERLVLDQADGDREYLILWLRRKDQATIQFVESNPHLRLINERKNKKGDRVAIFETKHLAPD
jgi:hypothetical protein